MPDFLLFVYGTLRVGEPAPMARRLRSGAKLIGKGSAPGALYDLGVLSRRYLRARTKTRVTGEVFVVQSGTRPTQDRARHL